MDHDGRLTHCEFGLGETARDLDFVQDYASSIHYGLVEFGGFRRYGELDAYQNRSMYRQEQSNMVAFNTMGGARYLRLVHQQSTGIHPHADTTDAGEDAEMDGTGSDEIPVEQENQINMEDNRTYLVSTLRELLNETLAVEEFRDGACIQQLIIMVLNTSPGEPIAADEFQRLTTRIVGELESRRERAASHSRSRMVPICERYITEFTLRLESR